MPTIDLAGGWQPRRYQRDLWNYLVHGGKRALVFWHRRAGKDDIGLRWTAVSAIERAATYWHMLPEATQARRAIWEAVNPHTGDRRIDEAFPEAVRTSTQNHEMLIRFCSGSAWHVVGSDNYNSLVGSPPYGAVFSEWALANPAAWAYIQPILEENGGWAAFITTPRGKNHAYKMLEMARSRGWFTQVLRADETGVFTDEQLKNIQAELIGTYGADMGRAMFDQEYLCSFDAAILGSYWGAELAAAERDGRIGRVEVDPALPVHTAWDLGVGTHLAIWYFQAVGGRIRVVDFYQAPDGSIETAAAALIGKGYPRGHDFVPHDAKAKEISTGRTRVETMIKVGLRPRLVADHTVDDGINASRLTIQRAVFDGPRCHDGLEALKAYRRKWDEKKQTFGDHPEHDWASHPADAWRYLSMAWRDLANEPMPAPGKRLMVGNDNEVSLDDILNERRRERRVRL